MYKAQEELQNKILNGKIHTFGVVGNFANHLEQAGEAKDFACIQNGGAPKGIFPIYIPGDSTFLGRNCFDNSSLVLPSQNANCLQAEPEMAIICDVTYKNNKVDTLRPKAFCAFNDASLRSEAEKISSKKNFSSGSKAIGTPIFIDSFTHGGICDSYSLTSFILYKNGKNEILKRYGECARATNYTYFYTTLITWLINCLNTQEDKATLESIPPFLASHPSEIVISIGASCYMEIAKSRYLQSGDEICVAVFNHKMYGFRDVRNMFVEHKLDTDGVSALTQIVRS